MTRKASIVPGLSRRTKKPSSKVGKQDSVAIALKQIDQIPTKSAQAQETIALLKSWLQDETGYDEATWPRLKQSLETQRKRQGARRLFHD